MDYDDFWSGVFFGGFVGILLAIVFSVCLALLDSGPEPRPPTKFHNGQYVVISTSDTEYAVGTIYLASFNEKDEKWEFSVVTDQGMRFILKEEQMTLLDNFRGESCKTAPSST